MDETSGQSTLTEPFNDSSHHIVREFWEKYVNIFKVHLGAWPFCQVSAFWEIHVSIEKIVVHIYSQALVDLFP